MNCLALALTAVALCPSLSIGDAQADGRAWLAKTEARLYTWPKPGCLVRFQVRTNLLEPAIAAMEKDPQVAADPDKVRWMEGLKRASIRGTVDTNTGSVTTQVDLRYEPASSQGKSASDLMKSKIGSTISGAFQGLPLHDPAMLGSRGSVLGFEERGDAILVTVSGKGKDERNTIHLNRRTELPDAIDMPASSMRLKYVEVVPGRFAPSRLDVRTPSGKESRAEYAYQRAGELAFPSTIKISQGAQTAVLTFVSLQVEPRSP